FDLDEQSIFCDADDERRKVVAHFVFHELDLFPFDQFALGFVRAALGEAGALGNVVQFVHGNDFRQLPSKGATRCPHPTSRKTGGCRGPRRKWFCSALRPRGGLMVLYRDTRPRAAGSTLACSTLVSSTVAQR